MWTGDQGSGGGGGLGQARYMENWRPVSGVGTRVAKDHRNI